MKETLRFFVIGVFLILMVLWACQFQNEKSNDPIYVKVKVNLDKNRSAQLSVLNRVDSLDSGPSYAVVETSTVLIYAVAGGTSVSASSYSTMEYIDRQLMDTSDNTVTLLIPIDTQIKLVLVRFSSAHSLANIIQYTPTASEIKKSGIFTVLGTDSVMTITLLSIQGEVYSGYMGEGIQGTDLNLSGTVTTLAGDGVYASVDGTGDLARLDYPHDIATDGTYLYVVDKNTSGTNGRIRKINIQTSYVSTIAGGATGGGTQCDGSNSTNCYDGTGTAAQFWQPAGITILNGYLYIADQANQRIRQVEIATGIVTTLAGS
ncbi:hypothetical protein KKA14_08155, partial [bacterium]|nr:hypothetical protein [bacterium]